MRNPFPVPAMDMNEDHNVTVYRFARIVNGLHLCPAHMWGTIEAISGLDRCTPLLETARRIHRKLLEGGFFYEQTPTAFHYIEEVARFTS